MEEKGVRYVLTLGRGKRHFIDEGRLSLGRSAKCVIRLGVGKNSVHPMLMGYGVKNDPEKSSVLMYDNGQRNVSEGKTEIRKQIRYCREQ